MTKGLRIKLLGKTDIYLDQKNITDQLRPQELDLLTCMVVKHDHLKSATPKKQRKDLVNWLYSESAGFHEDVNRDFRGVFHGLRNCLGNKWFHKEGNTYNAYIDEMQSGLTVDLFSFNKILLKDSIPDNLTESMANKLENAIKLYEDQIAQPSTISSTSDFTTSLLYLNQNLRTSYINALLRLLNYYRSKQKTTSVQKLIEEHDERIKKSIEQAELPVHKEELVELNTRWIQYKRLLTTPIPYPGLRPFSEQDTTYFYGREKKVDKLEARIRAQNFLAVIGSSGSGKSSLVFAGLLPRLKKEAIWCFFKFTPKELNPQHKNGLPFLVIPEFFVPILHPNMVRRLQLNEIHNYANEYTKKAPSFTLAQNLNDTLLALESSGVSKFLLVIDQFEEVFTSLNSETQQRFFQQLSTVIETSQDSNRSIKIIVTMRADFMGKALDTDFFRDLEHEDNLFPLGAMTRENLNQAIEKPASRIGVNFEPGLVSTILDDVGNEPGKLPLLQFSLSELFKEQNEELLTFSAYEKIGRVQGALRDYANRIYNELNPVEKKEARFLFMRLIKPGVGTESTRRSATLVELDSISEELIEKFADARLLVLKVEEINSIAHKNQSETIIIELAHEALIHHWPQLQTWLSEYGDFLAWLNRFRASIEQWELANKDEGALLQGTPLRVAKDWLSKQGEFLEDHEKKFIQQSILLKKRLEEEEEARQKQHEVEKEVARKRTRRMAYLGLIAGAFGFTVAYLIVFSEEKLSQSLGLLIFEAIVRVLPGAAAGLMFVMLLDPINNNQYKSRKWLLAAWRGAVPISFLFLYHSFILHAGVDFTFSRASTSFFSGAIFGSTIALGYLSLKKLNISSIIGYPFFAAVSGIILVFLEIQMSFPFSDFSNISSFHTIALAGIVMSFSLLMVFQIDSTIEEI